MALRMIGTRTIRVMLVATLIYGVFGVGGVDAFKDSDKCSEVGLTRWTKGVMYKCVAAGKNLIWDAQYVGGTIGQSFLPGYRPDSLFCRTGSLPSQCVVYWSNGGIPLRRSDPLKGAPKGKVVDREGFTNRFGKSACAKLWENGVVTAASMFGYCESLASVEPPTSPIVPSLESTATTQVAAKPFQIGNVKTYVLLGGSQYRQWFSYHVSANPNGNIPKSLCLFIDGQPYKGVIGPQAENPLDSSPKQNCINSSELAAHRFAGDFGFDFSLKEYPGAVEGDRHEVFIRWEFDKGLSIASIPKSLVFTAIGRWAWNN